MSQSKPKIRSWPIALGIFVLGAGVSGIAFYVSTQAQEQRLKDDFSRRVQDRVAALDAAVQGYNVVLESTRLLYRFSEHEQRSDLAGVFQQFQSSYPGLIALEWAPLVLHADRARVEASVRAEGFPDFVFKDRIDPDRAEFRVAPEHAEYLPVIHCEPLATNRPALGFNILSGRTAPEIATARATGRTIMTPRLRLFTSGNETQGFIVYLPVPEKADPAVGPGRFRGVVAGVFRLDQLLAGILKGSRDHTGMLEVLIVDDSVRNGGEVLGLIGQDGRIRVDELPAEKSFVAPYTIWAPFPLWGRNWELLFRPTPRWLAANRSGEPVKVLGLGLLASGALALFVYGRVRRSQVIELQVTERTAQLREAQKLLEEDIQQRKLTEAELQENRRQLSNLISQLPGAAFRCQFDEKLTMLFASEGMLALTGYPAEDFLTGRMLLPQLTVPADRPLIRGGVAQAIAERRPFEIEYRLTHRNGQEKWVLVRGRPIYDEGGGLRFLEGLAIDVTALKLAEQEKLAIERKLLAAQKLESLGVLAGGIAHDFNNILTSVLANASLARHDAGAGRPVDRSLEKIEHAARRAADLCQQMLAYAGKGKIVTDRVNLSELVRGTAALLEVTISKSTRLDLHLAGDLPPVLADPTQLRQIVMNLVINGADAIGSGTGLITVTTFARAADAPLLRSALGNPDLPPGTYIGLEVTDNGSGMTPETIARIFEPFFTTKFSGRGLGLSAVLGIVQSHRGALFVESAPGRGSTFRLLLPATTGPAVSSTPPFPEPVGAVVLRGTVLVVDDEEAVRSIAGTVLELHGATCLPAASGDAALDLLRTHGDRISLVLLDMTMPGISGEETLRRMRLLNARQPVILMSGYSETETMQHSANFSVAGFIQKPFEIGTLLGKVKPLLA